MSNELIASLPATGPFVDRIVRIFRDRPDDDTSAAVLQDYASAALSAQPSGVKALEWRGTDGVWAKAYALFGATYRITEYAGMVKPFKLETVGFVGASGHYELINDAKAAAQADYERRILSALSRPASVEGGEPVADWRDDPSADERWCAGLDFGVTQLCVALGIDPETVTFDAATETLDGDVQSVIWRILHARFGDDSPVPSSGTPERVPASAGERHETGFHLDRLNAWLTDLWAAKSIDLHMCDGSRRENQFGLLRDIRDDVAALRAATLWLAPPPASPAPQEPDSPSDEVQP